MNFNHKTVLISETLSVLGVKKDGIYVDGTAGGGGLSFQIASKLSKNGRLICIDRDPDAVKACEERLSGFDNVDIIHGNFSQVHNILSDLGINQVDGFALDLGVSSHQLDVAERGFSYNQDAFLDMRMSKQGRSAYDVVNFMSFEEIRNIISKYGEEKFAPKIARNIVKEREKNLIKTTKQLAQIVKDSVPFAAKRDQGHPARRTFQAIRIFVNNELGSLEAGLDSAIKVLKKGGILAVITFHSLEDRIVKQKMNSWAKGCVCPPDFPVCVCGKKPEAEVLTKKPIVPSSEEVSVNFRSRSAKLRVCKKI